MSLPDSAIGEPQIAAIGRTSRSGDSAADEGLIEALVARLAGALPGPAAQRQFETELSYGRHCGPALVDARAAAVAILLYRHGEEWLLPLTVRPSTMRWHAGQVSLPGGAVEMGESTREAAVRELQEELGVSPAKVTPLGALSPVYLFNSNFVVTPWVMATDARPEFTASALEVAELLEVPLAYLLDPRHIGTHQRSHRGLTFSAPHWLFESHRIWGATSMILAELVALVAK